MTKSRAASSGVAKTTSALGQMAGCSFATTSLVGVSGSVPIVVVVVVALPVLVVEPHELSRVRAATSASRVRVTGIVPPKADRSVVSLRRSTRLPAASPRAKGHASRRRARPAWPRRAASGRPPCARRCRRLRDSRVLNQTIGELLPAAVAVALSPIPIVAIVLVLDSSRARRNGLAFAGGWVSGLTAVSVIVVLVASSASDPGSDAATGISWVMAGIGLLFLRCGGSRQVSNLAMVSDVGGSCSVGVDPTDLVVGDPDGCIVVLDKPPSPRPRDGTRRSSAADRTSVGHGDLDMSRCPADRAPRGTPPCPRE